MTKLPSRLSRRAVKQFFNKVPGPKWDYWFRHEKENGINELRVHGPFAKAYYNGEGLKEWLLAEAIYSPDDFDAPPPAPEIPNGWHGLVVRKHAMAG